MRFAIPRHNINFHLQEYALLTRSLFSNAKRGRPVKKFEEEFAKLVGADYCVAFFSGSAALYHAILASPLKKGDKVIFPTYEFTTVPETLRLCGLDLVYAKVNPDTGSLEADQVRHVMEDGVKAVLVANIYGRPAPLYSLREVCDEYGILLIEDCAHSTGATINGKSAGSFGDISIFSFGHGKTLASSGGGAAVTNVPQIGKRLRQRADELKSPGWKKHARQIIKAMAKGIFSKRLVFTLFLFPLIYLFSRLAQKTFLDRFSHRGSVIIKTAPASYNYFFTDTAAQIGLLQMEKLASLNQIRRKNGDRLRLLLKGVEGIKLPPAFAEGEMVDLNFAVKVDDVKKFCLAMLQKGIDTRKDYLLNYSEEYPHGTVPLNTLYLPNHPGLCANDMDYISKVVKNYLSEHSNKM